MSSNILIITGMHRSGTSLIASILQESGLNIGQELLKPGKENPRGFFEDVDFFSFHENALKQRGFTFLDVNNFAFEPTREEQETATKLLNTRQKQHFWGWKEPRTCLFLDFWHRLLPQARFLFLYRHPLEVHFSLLRGGYYSNAGMLEGLNAWYQYNLRVQKFCVQYPEKCILGHPNTMLVRIKEFRELLGDKFGDNLKINSRIVETVYHPQELKHLVITDRMAEAMSKIHLQAIAVYQQLETIANFPSINDLSIARTVPDDIDLSKIMPILKQFAPAVQGRILLLLLTAKLEPELVEAFYTGHHQHLVEIERMCREQKQFIDGQQEHINHQNTYINQLEQKHKQLQYQLDHEPIPDALLNRISSKDIAQRIPVRKVGEGLGYKLARRLLPANVRTSIYMARRASQVEWQSKQYLGRHNSRTKPADLEGVYITVVYSDNGSPARYRVTNQLTQMEAIGLKPALFCVDDLSTIDALAQTDLLYFYRVEANLLTKKLVKLARQQHIPVVYDTDDLIWDQRIKKFCFLPKHFSATEVEEILALTQLYEEIMSQVDAFVFSTPFLAQLAQSYFGKKAYINKNSVSSELLTLSEPLYQARLVHENNNLSTVTVGYFSGWPKAHQEDFEQVVEPLRRLLVERPQVRLKVVGYLELDGLFPGCEQHVQTQNFVPWDQLPAAISQVDINIAPLVDNLHRRSKSAVKFLEAALVGTPTVASNLEPYHEIEHGQTGLLATTPDDWYTSLVSLVDSPDLRRRLGMAARQQVLTHDTVQTRALQFKEVLTRIIADYYG